MSRYLASTLGFVAVSLFAARAMADAALTVEVGTTPPPPEPPPPAAAAEPAAEDTSVQAGSHGGLFYVRNKSDDFRLYVQGRAHVDMYNYFGPGVSDVASLKSTLFLRRVRPELSGEFLQGKWKWMLAGDWGMGTTATAAGQAVNIRAQPTDVFLIFHGDPLFNLQVGQYDIPFTMENRTSDKVIPFMERSLAVRALGVPTNKDIGLMAWGETVDRFFFYSVGVFNGDGQNKPSVDNRADVYGRVFVHPLANSGGAAKDLQIGASGHYGVRDTKYVLYDYPSLSTQGTFTFFNPTKGTTHVLPSGSQIAFAGELRVPIHDFEFQGEFVYVNNGTREAIDTFQATNSERFGAIKGYAYYAQIGYWPMGGREIIGNPGYENPPHVDLKKPDTSPKTALQLLLRFEQLNVKYDSASRTGTDNPATDGTVKVNAFSLGVNYWATKHVRLTMNYVLNMFPDSAPATATTPGGPVQTDSQRAVAPGNTLAKGVNDDARDNAHMLHELLFRAAIAF